VGSDGILRYPVLATAINDDDSNISKVEDSAEPSTILMEAHELSKLIISIANQNMSTDKKPMAIYMFPNHFKALVLVLSYFMENCANENDAGNLLSLSFFSSFFF
jgi:hypothetical protein